MVAGQSGLIEDGSVTADEAPVGSLDDTSGIIFNGQADVEDLAVVVHVSVVAVGLALALEAGLEWRLEQGLSICWESERQGVGWAGGLG